MRSCTRRLLGHRAGLIAGCIKARIKTRVIGVSAERVVCRAGKRHPRDPERIGSTRGSRRRRPREAPIDVDDRFVGGGYGVESDDSREALELTARTEAIFLDHTYTAKAMAGLIARMRSGEFADDETVLFWHTGGQVGLFR